MDFVRLICYFKSLLKRFRIWPMAVFGARLYQPRQALMRATKLQIPTFPAIGYSRVVRSSYSPIFFIKSLNLIVANSLCCPFRQKSISANCLLGFSIIIFPFISFFLSRINASLNRLSF